MAEETEAPEIGAEASASGVDPAAVALALAGAGREEANAFLEKQASLIDDQRKLVQLQAKELAHELKLRHWSLQLRHASAILKFALEVSLAMVGIALACFIGAVVWNAAHADGLVIESFAVPPDLAVKGQSGQVVATQLLDQINLVENASASQARPGRALSGGWSDDVKVEIPETGVSIGELYRFLRRWLGHEAHLGGEVVHTPNGLALTVRIDGANSAIYTGPENDLNRLVLKAAEHLVQVTQPSRYSAYLMIINPPRAAEAQAVAEQTAADNLQTPLERSTAYNDLYVVYQRFKADDRKANEQLRLAEKADPDYAPSYLVQINSELNLGHAQAALDIIQPTVDLISRTAANYYPESAIAMPAFARRVGASLLGDEAEEIRQSRIGLASDRAIRLNAFRHTITLALARQHDGSALRTWLSQQPANVPRQTDTMVRVDTLLQAQAAMERWQQVIDEAPKAEKAWAQFDNYDVANRNATQVKPFLALARAKTGDIAGAEATIAATPGDCYDCVSARGQIASEGKQWGRADYWFAKAAADAPSIPMAYEDWGRSFLARGKPDDAIAKFKLANQKGPHFADPLEGWGEALMAKNQSHLALAKFAEAEKYAPNWGRLHLKWGEALFYAGKKDEAKAQFVRAAQLDLTPSEKAELAAVRGHGD